MFSQILSLIISSEITVRFSLKEPIKQINTLEELADSDMKLVGFNSLLELQNIKDKNVQDRIVSIIEQDKTLIQVRDIYNDSKWIQEVADGKSAIFMVVVPLKWLSIVFAKHLKPNTKFHFIAERYRNPFILTLASSRRLTKKFRDQLNLRFENYHVYHVYFE